LKLYNTFEEVQENIKEAIELYLEVLQERGETIPEPTTKVGGWSGREAQLFVGWVSGSVT